MRPTLMTAVVSNIAEWSICEMRERQSKEIKKKENMEQRKGTTQRKKGKR
jgi:hypothetical protein